MAFETPQIVDVQDVLFDRPATAILPTDAAGLKEFLARPLLIKTVSWNTTHVVDTNLFGAALSPEGEYLALNPVRRKVSDYKYIRGKFVVRAVVNGCPHSYGRLQLVNIPMLGNDVNDRATANSVWSQTRFLFPTTSQTYAMDPVMISPTAAGSYEMILPTETVTGWIEIATTSPSPLGTSGAQGHLYYVLVGSPLRSVTSLAAPAVTINFYGYWEDVELAVSLSRVQSELKPEGIFSKPASILAKSLDVLGGIPQLKPYTTPFAAAAKMGSRMLANMGLSKPGILETYQPTMNQFSSTMAYTTGREAVLKSSMDPKCAVPVDAITAGVGTDKDMDLAFITSKPGLVGTVEWATTAATGTKLVEVPVNPQNYFPVSAAVYGTTPTGLSFAPVGYVSGAFQFWTGDLIYTFHIPCTAFHRGSLRIFFDPNGNSPARESDTINPLQQVLIDLDGPKTVDFCVPWSSQYSFKTLTVTNSYGPSFCNGTFYIVVNGPLETIGSTENVQIQYTVRAGPSFELARPQEPFTGSYKYYSDLEIQSAPCLTDTSSSDQIALCFGEKTVSLRDLLKRKNFMELRSLTFATTAAISYEVLAFIPLYIRPRAYVHDTEILGVGSSHFTHFQILYAAMRGGVRQIIRWYPLDSTPQDAFSRQFAMGYFSGTGVQAVGQNPFAELSSGAVVADVRQHPYLEVEIPFISTSKVVKASYVTLESNTASPQLAVASGYIGAASGTGSTEIMRGICAADDFSLCRFINVPILWN